MNKKTNTIIAITVIAVIMGSIVYGSSNQTDQPTPDLPESTVNEEIAGLSQENTQEETSAQEKASPQEETNNADVQLLSDEEEIFYWGTTCPFCHDVMDWMEENQVYEKLNVVKKEIYDNKENADELTQKADECGLTRIGVPLLYTSDGQCLIGPQDIIEYLENRIDSLEK